MARSVKGSGKRKSAKGAVKGDEASEEEYEVESIIAHKKVRGGLWKFNVKWKGYGSEWNTWEPEDNLHADELLKEYWLAQERANKQSRSETTPKAEDPKPTSARVASASKSSTKRRSSVKTEPRKRQRNSSGADETTAKEEEDDGADGDQRHKFVDSADNYDQYDDWEDIILDIETVERDDEGGKLKAFCIMTDGGLIKVDATVTNEKCPQKMLRFYESHLKWNHTE